MARAYEFTSCFRPVKVVCHSEAEAARIQVVLAAEERKADLAEQIPCQQRLLPRFTVSVGFDHVVAI